MTRAALFAALLTAAAAATSFADEPIAFLKDSFGDSGIETLASRGILVLQGKPSARRLAAVHWKALDALSRASASCLALTQAADSLDHDAPPVSPTLGLSACRALTAGSPLTPALAAIAAALEARNEELWSLAQTSAAASGAAARTNAFDTSWGKELNARHHADMLENHSSLTKPIFHESLAGPRPERDALALFIADAGARGVAAPDVLLVRDAASGNPSDELRAQLRRTLSDERRRWAAEKARATAAELLAKSSVKRELDDLRELSRVLHSRTNLSTALEAASARPASSGARLHLRSAGIHLSQPTRLGQHELGDTAIVSGAYWVDGLDEGASADVEETLVVETDRGFSAPATRTVKRGNGGPYPYVRAVEITQTRSFAVRAIVSSPLGPVFTERVEVPVAQDFELALLKESEAAGLFAACRFSDAESAYAALETLVAEAAKVKPQYKGLRARALKGVETSKAGGEILLKRDDALVEARADSAPQRCRYETDHVDAALKLSRRLPPGCDRDLPELHALRETIVRRAVDQAWFLEASASARSKRKSCDLEAARARWSEVLSALEEDPGARCGRVAQEETLVKTELPEVAREQAWRGELSSALSKAEAGATPARHLELLRPISARLGALKSPCLKSESRRAAALAQSAAKYLAAPSDDELLKRLPADEALASDSAAIRADRARRLEAATTPEKVAVAPPKPAAAEPAPKPATTKKAAPAKKTAARKAASK